MNRKSLVLVALLAGTALLVAVYGARTPQEASAAALRIDSPIESPLETPANAQAQLQPQSPLTAPDGVAPKSPLQEPLRSDALTPRALANMTYLSGYGEDGTVTLENGEYSKPVGAGSAARNAVTLLPEYSTIGMLNGLPAAVVVLRSGGGGSGSFYNLSVVVEHGGEPVNIATTEMGDRIRVNSIAIRDNLILVDMIAHGSRDPACCPTQEVINAYELRGNEILEVSSDVLGTVDAQKLAVQPATLEGRRWRLTRYRSADDEMVAASTDVHAVLTFDEGMVRGTSGCNSFFGGYEIDTDDAGRTIRFGEMGATAMACPETFRRQEQGLIGALNAAAIYSIADDAAANGSGADTLRLYDDERILAEFEAAAPATLVDLTWSATGYSDGHGGFTSLLSGAEITVEFDEDGTLRGNAGCNNYRAVYTIDADGETIEIGPATTTRMVCNKPEGVMQQEQDYLAALATAGVFVLEIDNLELRTTAGERVAAYQLQHGSGEAAGICNTNVLGNVAYTLDTGDETVQLRDGMYEDAPSRVVVEIMPDSIVCGDVTGDGQDDALVLLSANTGGTGVFVYLAIVSAEDGDPANIASVLLGDRVKVASVTVTPPATGANDGHAQVVVEMINQGPDDALCCPTQHAVNLYELVDDELLEIDGYVVEGLTYVKLANMGYEVEQTETGTAWLLRGIYEEPAAPESSALSTVMLLPESIAFGDVDGVSSAALVLIAQPGGTGALSLSRARAGGGRQAGARGQRSPGRSRCAELRHHRG